MPQDSANAPGRFLDLLRPLQRELELYGRRLLWDPQQLPDLLQNAVLRAFAAFDRYREDASFRAWMFKILTREAFALNRKHARIARHEFQLEPDEIAELQTAAQAADDLTPTPASLDALEPALEPGLTRALRTLTDTERAVLLLRAIAGLRYREISESLGVPIGTVMGSLSRARHKMRALLATPSTPSIPQPGNPNRP